MLARTDSEKCTLPLTGARVVDTIITEMAYIKVTQKGLLLEELAPGITVEAVQQATEPKLIISDDLAVVKS
jgi:3-oxoacid CoA-transferase subunit B